MNANITNLQNSIKSLINKMSGQKATFSNNYGYGRYLTKAWDRMSVNSVLSGLTRYNSQIRFNEKEKHFYISDELVAALKEMLKNDYNLIETTHVGCFDVISPSIYKQATIDGSCSVEEINNKLLNKKVVASNGLTYIDNNVDAFILSFNKSKDYGFTVAIKEAHNNKKVGYAGGTGYDKTAHAFGDFISNYLLKDTPYDVKASIVQRVQSGAFTGCFGGLSVSSATDFFKGLGFDFTIEQDKSGDFKIGKKYEFILRRAN